MRILIPLLIVLVVMPFISIAETESTDSSKGWPEGSAMHTGELLLQKQEKLNSLLATTHKELVKLASSATSSDGALHTDEWLIKALKTQQVAWLKYKDDECQLIGYLSGAGGAWPSTYAIECAVKLTDQRLRKVKSAIQCINEIKSEERLFEQNRCLEQLAPLINKTNMEY